MASTEKVKEASAPHEAAQEQGYFGDKVDPKPNSAYSLESGPQSPAITPGPDEPADYIKNRSNS